MKAKWTRELIREALSSIPGGIINGSRHYTELQKENHNLPSDWVLHNYFGGLENACKAYNISFIHRWDAGNIAFKERIKKVYSRKYIKNKIQELSQKSIYITDILEEVRRIKNLLYAINLYYGPINTQNHKEASKLFDKVLHKYSINHNHHKKWTKKVIKESILKTYNLYGPFNTSDLSNLKFRKIYHLPDYNKISEIFGSFEYVIKILNLPSKQFFIGERKVSKFASYCQGRNEEKILDNIEQKLGYKLLRQVRIGKYYVDGYDEFKNIVYEVDESHHQWKYQQKLDKERESKIKELIDCSFIRINENLMEVM